jgi:hypothetical protein
MKTTIKQKLIAGCLLALFLFITISKLLHSHDALSDAQVSGIEKVEAKSACPVCDYHLAKDVAFETTTFPLEKLQAPSSHFIFYQTRGSSSIGLSYADRGPPSLA